MLPAAQIDGNCRAALKVQLPLLSPQPRPSSASSDVLPFFVFLDSESLQTRFGNYCNIQFADWKGGTKYNRTLRIFLRQQSSVPSMTRI
jgi:hypothetical protein